LVYITYNNYTKYVKYGHYDGYEMYSAYRLHDKQTALSLVYHIMRHRLDNERTHYIVYCSVLVE
jgi:hypothetical protein